MPPRSRVSSASTLAPCAPSPPPYSGIPSRPRRSAKRSFCARGSGSRACGIRPGFARGCTGSPGTAQPSARRRAAARREVSPPLEAFPAPDPRPDDALDAARRERELWSAFEAVEPADREVLVAFYREGRSVREVATRLALAEPVVRKRLERARSRLRADVEQRLGERLERTAPRVAGFVAAVAAGVAVAPQAKAGALGIAVGAAIGAALLAGATFVPPALAPSAPSPAPVVTLAAEPGSPVGLPVHVVHAFLAAEDARFFAHGAVDWRATGRALWNTVGGGDRVDGGSTITQQLAKRHLGATERTVGTKVAEWIWAVQLERERSKESILAEYLDGVYLGSGVYGLTAGAELYFGVTPAELTVEQAATLAGLPAAPDRYDPIRHPEAASARRAWVLGRMAENGWLPVENARSGESPALSP